MFWQANKWGILALVAGLLALGAAYVALAQQGDEDSAKKVLSTGICVLLFVVALATWLSARQGGKDE